MPGRPSTKLRKDCKLELREKSVRLPLSRHFHLPLIGSDSRERRGRDSSAQQNKCHYRNGVWFDCRCRKQRNASANDNPYKCYPTGPSSTDCGSKRRYTTTIQKSGRKKETNPAKGSQAQVGGSSQADADDVP